MATQRAARVAYALALILGAGSGQPGATPGTPQTADDALHAMSQAAGVIFAGQVVAVRRHEGSTARPAWWRSSSRWTMRSAG